MPIREALNISGELEDLTLHPALFDLIIIEFYVYS